MQRRKQDWYHWDHAWCKEKNEHNQNFCQPLRRTGRQRQGKQQTTPKTTVAISFPADATSRANLPRKVLGCWDTCGIGCFAQFIAFGCAHFRSCLTASGIYLVMDCIEKCKEAFNSDHVGLVSLCSQTEKYWSIPGQCNNGFRQQGIDTCVSVTATNSSELPPPLPIYLTWNEKKETKQICISQWKAAENKKWKKCITWLDKTGRKMRCQHTEAEHRFCCWTARRGWSAYAVQKKVSSIPI